MKINVRINDELYEVEVGDVRARPVIATIEGERFELWPELETTRAESGAAATVSSAPAANVASAQTTATAQTAATTQTAAKAQSAESATNSLRAPIPGVILSIAVQTGDTVERGQEVCVLEAMKMNNTLRASRAGVIASVHITVGQHVKHGDLLIEYI